MTRITSFACWCRRPVGQAVLVALAGVAVRLLVWWCLLDAPAAMQFPDTPSYVLPAHNLVAHGVFSKSAVPPLEPYLMRTPGYPAFLALFVFGGCYSPGGVTLVQVLLAGVVIYCTARLAQRLIDPGRGWVAGLIVALDPAGVLASVSVLADLLFVLVSLGTVVALERVRPAASVRARWGWLLLSGLLGGLATLVRPVGMFFAVAGVVLVVRDHRRERWQAAGKAAVWLMVFVLPIQLWCARNEQVAGVWKLTTIGSEMLLRYTARPLLVEANGITPALALARLRAAVEEQLPAQPTVGEEDAARMRVAVETITGHPLGLARLSLSGLARLLGGTHRTLWARLVAGEESAILLARPPGWMQANNLLHWLVVYPVLYGLCLVGLYALWRERDWRAGAFVLLPLAYYVILSIPYSATYSRFRVPLMPYLALLFTLGLVYTLKQMRR